MQIYETEDVEVKAREKLGIILCGQYYTIDYSVQVITQGGHCITLGEIAKSRRSRYIFWGRYSLTHASQRGQQQYTILTLNLWYEHSFPVVIKKDNGYNMLLVLDGHFFPINTLMLDVL